MSLLSLFYCDISTEFLTEIGNCDNIVIQTIFRAVNWMIEILNDKNDDFIRKNFHLVDNSIKLSSSTNQ